MALEDVLRNFDNVIRKEVDAVEKAIYEVGADLKTESVEITPFDSGDLRKSAKLEMKREGNRIYAEVSFGDATVDYALKLHEEKAKLYSEPGTSWKYLERPLKQNASKYKRYIEEAARGALK